MSKRVPHVREKGPSRPLPFRRCQGWENLCVTSRAQPQRGGRPQLASGPVAGTPHRHLKSMSGGLGTLASLPDRQLPPSASLGQDRTGRKHRVSLGLPGTREHRSLGVGGPQAASADLSRSFRETLRGRGGFSSNILGGSASEPVPVSSPPAGLPPCTGLSSGLPNQPGAPRTQGPFKYILIQRHPEPDRPGGAGPVQRAAWGLLVA